MALENIPGRVLLRLVTGIDAPDVEGCWTWTGYTIADGYGRLAWAEGGARRSVATHRAAYELWVGDIPDPLTVDHTCHNRRCCNPAHLRLLTHSDNAKDNGHSSKTHCPQGHPYSGENLAIHQGRRHCRMCRIDRCRAFHQNRKSQT